MTPKFHILLFLLCTFAVAIGCGKKPTKENSNHQNDTVIQANKDGTINGKVKIKKNVDTLMVSLESTTLDTSFIYVDTSISIPNYTLVITHEKFDANKKRLTMDDVYYNPVSIYIVSKENDSVVHKKKFEENQFVSYYTFKNASENYISLSSFGGGSGFVSTIYKIETNKSFQFTNIFTYNELTYYAFNSDGSEILGLQGIWDMFTEGKEGEIGETHFADHAYDLFTINTSATEPKPVSHGTTKHKYPSEDSGTTVFALFNLIQKREPNLCKTIRIDQYPKE